MPVARKPRQRNKKTKNRNGLRLRNSNSILTSATCYSSERLYGPSSTLEHRPMAVSLRHWQFPPFLLNCKFTNIYKQTIKQQDHVTMDVTLLFCAKTLQISNCIKCYYLQFATIVQYYSTIRAVFLDFLGYAHIPVAAQIVMIIPMVQCARSLDKNYLFAKVQVKVSFICENPTSNQRRLVFPLPPISCAKCWGSGGLILMHYFLMGV